MGKHGLGEMNEKGKLFVDFCSLNKLVIGGSIFPHKDTQGHLGFFRQINRTENQIDQICVSSKFRRSLLDVKVKRGANMGRCRLKLKKIITPAHRRQATNTTYRC